MDLIYNFWALLSNDFADEALALLQIAEVPDGPGAGDPVPAVTFPLINYYKPATAKTIINQPNRVEQAALFIGPYTVWNMVTTASDLSELVPAREDFQDWHDRYPDDFIIAGAWRQDGQPIGGVGSPWFVTPPELIEAMPNGYLEDVVITFGQSPRIFL